MKLKHKQQEFVNKQINTFKFYLIMLSSSGWMVQLKGMNLR